VKKKSRVITGSAQQIPESAESIITPLNVRTGLVLVLTQVVR